MSTPFDTEYIKQTLKDAIDLIDELQKVNKDQAGWITKFASNSAKAPLNMSVLQDWVVKLPFMQQSVLLAAVRGPDGINKDHPVKTIMRWYRRSILICAFDKVIHSTPYEPCGGNFTGALDGNMGDIDIYLRHYIRSLDELPHHFQMHLLHAAEIIGYQHPNRIIGDWWQNFYNVGVADLHLLRETKEQMNERLSDNEENWRAREAIKSE